MKKEETECEWMEIRLPRGFGGSRCCIGAQSYLHLWEAGDHWSVYVSEERIDEAQVPYNEGLIPPAAISHFVSWGIQLDGKEICGGHLRTVRSAKDVALTVLAALMDGPKPEVPDDDHIGHGHSIISQ